MVVMTAMVMVVPAERVGAGAVKVVVHVAHSQHSLIRTGMMLHLCTPILPYANRHAPRKQ